MKPTEAPTHSALIIDDEPLARDLIRHMLAAHPDIQILAECANGLEALNAIETRKPDLIFLDIKMPGLTGMELAQKLDPAQSPVIVFITAYDHFALEAFEQNAIDYLLKPFDQERFDQTLERARHRFAQQSDAAFGRQLKAILATNPLNASPTPIDRIAIKETGRVFFVSPSEVDYFEAAGNYVALHIGSKTRLVHDTLTKMEEKLDTKNFVRIHRSTIVNIQAIKELRPHFNGEYIVVLKNGSQLKLSRSYSDTAKPLLGLD